MSEPNPDPDPKLVVDEITFLKQYISEFVKGLKANEDNLPDVCNTPDVNPSAMKLMQSLDLDPICYRNISWFTNTLLYMTLTLKGPLCIIQLLTDMCYDVNAPIVLKNGERHIVNFAFELPYYCDNRYCYVYYGTSCIKILVDAGADLTKIVFRMDKDKFHDLADIRCNYDIINVLISSGVDANVVAESLIGKKYLLKNMNISHICKNFSHHLDNEAIDLIFYKLDKHKNITVETSMNYDILINAYNEDVLPRPRRAKKAREWDIFNANW